MKKTNVFIALFLAMLFFHPTHMKALEQDYSVNTEISEFQRDKEKSYFDLRLKPNQVTSIFLSINNMSETENTFYISANPALTSSTVNISYNVPNPKTDASMKYPFQTIAKVKTPTVKVPPKQSKRIEIEIKMPAEEFDGIILGGIHTSRELTDEEKKQSGYVNTISYVNGVCISENDTKIKPELTLNKVEVSQANGSITVNSTITNPTAINLSPLTWKATMTDKTTNKIVKEQKQGNAMIAPNTTFTYPMKFITGELKSGHYQMKITATLPDKREWVLTKDFDVTVKEIEKYEAQAGGLAMTNRKPTITNPLLFGIIGVASAICIVGGILFIIGKKRKKNEEVENEIARELREIEQRKRERELRRGES
ncbi:Protein of unknown function C-terminal [Pilibacter termitis]|uniref:Uncharacterized protein n=1 Tax=Pilibacter termitis TaxID=263852 RepID=A0A1T4KBH9_9ENTE|nr:DUF916 and DUF3324 domain-containing protein [Pilibacter termitis]SJZ39752.1 Protein of unknown function C-terminal [Pilibacter termitis]